MSLLNAQNQHLTRAANLVFGLELPPESAWEYKPLTVAELADFGLDDTLLEFHLAVCQTEAVKVLVPLMGEVPHWLAARAYTTGSSLPLGYSQVYLAQLYKQQEPRLNWLKAEAERRGLVVQRPILRSTPEAEGLTRQLLASGIRKSFHFYFLQTEQGVFWGRFEDERLTEMGLEQARLTGAN